MTSAVSVRLLNCMMKLWIMKQLVVKGGVLFAITALILLVIDV